MDQMSCKETLPRLDMQAGGHRCVSALVSDKALRTVYGHRGCLEMLLHDLPTRTGPYVKFAQYASVHENKAAAPQPGGWTAWGGPFRQNLNYQPIKRSIGSPHLAAWHHSVAFNLI